VTYSIEGDLVKVEMVGSYSLEEAISQLITAVTDPRCPTPVKLVLDVSRSDTLATRPTEDIKRVAELAGPYRDRIGRRVAVVAEKDVHFGLSRLGSVYSQDVGVDAQVFRTQEEALAWLGVNPAPNPEGSPGR
jgi:hypothetical protein